MREKSIKCVCLGLGLNLCGLAACSSQEETLPDNQPFLITSSIQGVSLSRAPHLDASGKGKFTDGDVNTLFFMGKDGGLSRIFPIPTGIRIIGMMFS